MPTSAPGSSANRAAPRLHGRSARGFTLVELLIVIAIIALSVSLVVLALPDGDAAKLEEEGARLSALLDIARAEARVSGATVRWVPRAPGEADPMSNGSSSVVNFRFVGLQGEQDFPTRWLDPRTRAQVVGATTVLLGPEAILPPQRVVLRLGEQRLELASDGLGPFTADPAQVASAP